MAKKETTVPVEQCENMDMELLRRQMKRLEDAVTTIQGEMSKLASSNHIPTLMPSEPTVVELPEINIPDNLATNDDINTLSGIIKTMNGSLALVVQGMSELKTAFENMPKPEDKTDEIVKKASEAFSSMVIADLKSSIEKGHKESYYNGQRQNDGISAKDATDIYRQIGGLRTDENLKGKLAKSEKSFRILALVVVGLVDIIFGMGYWIHSLRSENNELAKIEWLYRSQRTSSSQSFLDHIEKDFLYGEKKDIEEWKTLIIEHEAKAPEFRYFHPHDKWKPKAKKENSVTPAVSEETQSERKPLPHEQKSHLTPVEKAANEFMRNNPHIPADAKPPITDD